MTHLNFGIEEKNRLLMSINEALTNHMYEQDQIGFLVGKSGSAVFKFMFSDLFDDEKSYDEAIELILNCHDEIENGYNNTTYCSGLAGYLWSLDFIDSSGFCNIEVEENMNLLNPVLHNMMITCLEEGNYDFFQGALGYAVLFLRRFQNAKDNSKKRRYKKYIQDFIVQLRKFAIYEADTVKWPRKLKSEDFIRSNYYDIGLAHGIPSILAYLKWVAECPQLEIDVNDLIIGIIKYLITIENNIKEISRFPNELGLEADSNISRVAWCYGDLGVGQVLMQCGNYLEDSDLTNWAVKILLSTADRTSPKEHLVHDACLCHGSFGNAMVFKEAFKVSGEPKLLGAYHFWMNLGYEMGNDKSGYAGYKFYNGGSGKWKNELSVLEGITGIGMALIENLKTKSCSWSHSLLIG